MKGLEPPRLAAPDPKSGASTNSATSASFYTLSVLPGWLRKINTFSLYPDRITKCHN